MLDLNKCDYPEVYEFLSLLKKQSFEIPATFEPINVKEWHHVVKKAKKKSALSIFLSRSYSIYKYALGSKTMINILI